jgi:hypothetical protein
MTFGLSERNSREKANALNSGIAKGKKSADVPKLAARAFAMNVIRDTFAADRPTIATRNKSVATCESV